MNILANSSVYQTNTQFTIHSTSPEFWVVNTNLPNGSYTILEAPPEYITIIATDPTSDFVISKGTDSKNFIIVDELFATYDGRESIINTPATEMIHGVDSCGVAVNSSGDYRAFNSIIESVYDNIDYLLDYSNSLGGFPISYENRYGYINDTDLGWSGYPDNLSNTWVYGDAPNDRMMVTNNTNVIMVNKPNVGANSITIQDQGGTPSQPEITQHGYLGYAVGDVKAIHASESTFIILDNTVNNSNESVTVLLIYVRDGTTYNLATYWGDDRYGVVYPSPESLAGAIDMAVYNDDIYILLENEIKIFNNIGYLIQTIDIHDIENPISIGVANDKILVADVDETVLPATSKIIEIDTLTLDTIIYNVTGWFENYTSNGFYEGAPIRTIATGGVGTYFYIVTDTLVYKLTYDYKLVDKFGEIIADVAYNAGTESSADEYRITYVSGGDNACLAISTNYDTHRVTDTILLLAMIDGAVSDKLWPLSKCFIDGGEYATDWVYNRCFNRIYDNIDHIHRSVIGVPNTTFNLPINEVGLGGFRPSQYSALPFNKDEIYVGMNEIHAEPSINRGFRMIYKCMVHILDILSQSNYTISGTVISLTDFDLVNFTGFSDLTPETGISWVDERDDGVVYFDIGRSIGDLEFSWTDTFEGNRSDPNFTRAFKYRYTSYEFISDTTQYSFIDSPEPPYIDNDGGSGGEWGVRIAYNVMTESEHLQIKWNRRIYIGVMDQTEDINETTIMESINGTFSDDDGNVKSTTGGYIKNDGDINLSIPVNVGTDQKYFVAVPTELSSSTLKPLASVGLDDTYYTFTDGNVVSIVNFENEYSYDAGDYNIYVGNVNGGVFTTNSIEFRLSMLS